MEIMVNCTFIDALGLFSNLVFNWCGFVYKHLVAKILSKTSDKNLGKKRFRELAFQLVSKRTIAY